MRLKGERGILSDEPIYLLGTGVLAEELFAVARDSGVEIAGFVENLDPGKDGATLCRRPILWFEKLPPDVPCVCALSTTKRERFIGDVTGRARFVNLVHRSAIILPGTRIGEGTVVSVGAVIASNTTLGRHVFVNRTARIGHHTRVGNYVTVQPGANVAGLIEICDRAYIGMGATIIERLKIGAGATVAAGAVVIHDVPEQTLVAGVPAVVKKRCVEAR